MRLLSLGCGQAPGLLWSALTIPCVADCEVPITELYCTCIAEYATEQKDAIVPEHGRVGVSEPPVRNGACRGHRRDSHASVAGAAQTTRFAEPIRPARKRNSIAWMWRSALLQYCSGRTRRPLACTDLGSRGNPGHPKP